MSPLLQAFSSAHVPPCLWSGGVLHLPSPLVIAHREYLAEKGWSALYVPSAASGAIGGASDSEAQDHVVNRFLNSAARMQFVCVDPKDEQEEIRNAVLEQLASGALHIVDLAAGNGAGTLAVLSVVCQLRRDGLIPKFPLNVYINAVDCSPSALNHFAALKARIDDWITGSGIHVELVLSVCDLTIPAELNEYLENFFHDAKVKGVRRFLCTISAVSGLKKEGLESIFDSLKHVATMLGHSQRNSTWLWVEPGAAAKNWFSAFVSSIKLTMTKIGHKLLTKGETFALVSDGAPSMPELISRKFVWTDPHLAKVTSSHVVVVVFKNS